MARAPRLLIHNWHLKLSAFGLSVFLWALVQTEPLSQETFSSVPVTVVMLDTAWTMAGSPTPATVELRLGGPAREIIRLAREGTSLRVPITAVGSPDTLVAVQRDWVQLGQRAGVTVESVSPQMIGVTFEPAASRDLPVSMRTEGTLPVHLALSSPLDVSPHEVLARGPEGRLSALDSLPLVPFDLGRVEESGAFTLGVDTAGLSLASVVPGEVTLGVRVEARVERVLDGVAVHADLPQGSAGLVVEPPVVQLRLSGARTLVTVLDLSLLRLSVDPEALRGMELGEVRRLRVQVDGLPPLITASPSTEVVTVRRASQEPDPAGRDSP